MYSFIEAEPKMIGAANEPVQIDEWFFSGRRKYGKGGLLQGNVSNELTEWSESDTATYGVDDPRWCWVLGIHSKKKDVRFVPVRDRSKATLIPIVEEYVVIVTDLWGGYNGLTNAGFTHETVNHSGNYVDPNTGYHTQGIERAWRTAKVYLYRAMGNRRLFQSSLDEAAWRMKRGNNLACLLPTFLDDIKTFYG